VKHSTQRSWSTTARDIEGSMSMAPTGQTGTQFPQATHRSVEILTP
jgi:hypothetical protein